MHRDMNPSRHNRGTIKVKVEQETDSSRVKKSKDVIGPNNMIVVDLCEDL